MNAATFRRDTAATALVTTAVLSTVSSATAPEFPSGYAERLVAIEEVGALAWISVTTFALAQLPFIVAVLGIGHLLRHRAPRLSVAAVCLATLGAFGHAVVSGTMITSVAMAQDTVAREPMAALLEDVESTPAAILFMAPGLLGTVLGLVLLAVALWRTGTGPRWVPALLGAFLVVEFVGSGLSDWASQVAAVMYLVSFVALARTVRATPVSDWESGAPAQASPALEPA